MSGDTTTFQASGIARFTAALLGIAAVLFAAWAVVVQVQDPAPASWPAGLVVIGALLLVARAARRVSVVATPSTLEVHTGLRGFSVPWDRVQGFWLCQSRRRGGVYVLISPDDIVLLPLAQAIWPARPDQQQAKSIVEALTACAERAAAPLIRGDLSNAAAQRLPTGEPRRRWSE